MILCIKLMSDCACNMYISSPLQFHRKLLQNFTTAPTVEDPSQYESLHFRSEWEHNIPNIT
jgi:hypothetical protein